MALRIGVTGKLGPNNWLEFVKNEWWVQDFGQIGILMQPEMALALQGFGFKSKDEIYKWIWEQSFITMYDMKRKGWYDFSTNAGTNIEPYSKKAYKDLADDFKIPANGGNPKANYVIVVGGEEEQSVMVAGGRGDLFPIDPWR